MARLSAHAGEGHGDPDQAAHAWRRVHHSLSPLRSIHPGPRGYGQASVLAHCLDRQLGRSNAGRALDPDWQAAAATIGRRLPQLASAGGSSLRRLDADLKILSRQTPTSAAPETAAVGPFGSPPSPYQPADTSLIDAAAEAFAAARQASADRAHAGNPGGTDAPLTGSHAAMLARLAFPTPFNTAEHTTAEPARPRADIARPRGRSR